MKEKIPHNTAQVVEAVAAHGNDTSRDSVQGMIARDHWGMEFPEVGRIEFVTPNVKHLADARKLELAAEAIRRVKDPNLFTPKREVIGSLAFRLANPDLSLEELAQNCSRPVELLRENLQSAQDAFEWATNALGMGNINGQPHDKG